MQLFNSNHLKDIPALYDQENKGNRAKVYLRVYIPNLGYEWLITEYDKEQELFFGFASLNDPDMAELGYISKIEIEDLSDKYRISVENIQMNLINAKAKYIFKNIRELDS